MLSRGQLYQKAVAKLESSDVGNARHEAAWILEETIGLTRIMIQAFPDADVSKEMWQCAWESVERRALGEPLQYVLGSQEFWGLDFLVSRDVLIPRYETELIMESVLSQVREHVSPLIIDVGTGSGCLAVAMGIELPHAQILALDRCSKAIRTALYNAQHHKIHHRIEFCVGDLLAPLLSTRLAGKVTAVVANLPYIREAEFFTLSPEVRDFEPKMALDGGTDGLVLYRRLLREAQEIVQPSGYVIVEVGKGQASTLCEDATRCGYRIHQILHDSIGIERVVCLERTGTTLS